MNVITSVSMGLEAAQQVGQLAKQKSNGRWRAALRCTLARKAGFAAQRRLGQSFTTGRLASERRKGVLTSLLDRL